MKNNVLVMVGLVLLSCNAPVENIHDGKDEGRDRKLTSIEPDVKGDSLTKTELFFLSRIANESQAIIIPKLVDRFVSKADSSAIINKLVYEPSDSLSEKGYVYLELSYYGQISEPHIFYSYSMGQADSGYGSVVGEDSSNYVHTVQSCGVSACITQVFRNGKLMMEHNENR